MLSYHVEKWSETLLKSLRNMTFISAESYFQIWVPGKDIHMISLL